MTKRRGHGEGGIRQRPDGRWEGSIDLGWVDGKRKRKFVYAKTRQEVVVKLRARRSELDSGQPFVDERQTVEQWLNHWLDNVLPGTVKLTTEANYANLARRHLIPSLGKTRLAKLDVRQIEELIADLGRAGKSPNTIRLVRSVLRRSLGHAVRQGVLVRNVVTLTDGPRIPRGTGRALTVEEAQKLLEACRDKRYEVGFVLLVETGMRLGELLGLRWDDVDLEAGQLNIRQTLSTLAGKIVLDEPKTASSKRPYELSVQAVEALKSHWAGQAAERLAVGEHWLASGLVLVTELGTPVDPNNFRKIFRKVSEEAGLEGCHPHELRHTAASLMLSRGVPLHVVSDVLGHSSISVTKDVYGHLVAGERRRATDAIAGALYGT
ncbi:MAG: tyrosine recombinase XerC [Acidimicrobiales bacterium]